MNINDAGRVLRKLVAFQPNTPRDEYTINAWAEGLATYDVADAMDAVTKVCCAPRPDGETFLVELRHIIAEVNTVRKVRAKRLEERRPLVQPPSCLEPAEYQAWLVATDKALMARDWTPPPAIEGTRDASKAITAALDALPTPE